MPGMPNIQAKGPVHTRLPLKTRCIDCHRLKSMELYAKKQQDSLRSLIATGKVRNLDDDKGEHIMCKECTPGPRSELQCSMCNVVKGLNGFARKQRKNNDHALCKVCSHRQTNLDPVATDPEQDELDLLENALEDYDSDMETVTNQHEGSVYSGVAVPSSMQSLSNNNLERHNGTSASISSVSRSTNAASVITNTQVSRSRARSDSSAGSELSFVESSLSPRARRAERERNAPFAKCPGPRRGIPMPEPEFDAGPQAEIDEDDQSEPEPYTW